MTKRILAAVCAAAMVISLAACSDSTDTSSSAPADSKVSSEQTDSTVSEDASSDEASSNETSDETSEDTSSEEEEYVSYQLDGELTPNMISKSRLIEGNKVRLANVIKKLQAGEEVTVGYIGGSITQGTSAGDQLCYAKLTTNWIAEQYPDAKVNYVNAGIGATGSYIGVHRVTDQLLSKNPDLVFVEFSVNDTYANTERDKESYDSLLRTIWAHETNPAIITIVTTQDNGTSMQAVHSEVAEHYDIPMISYHDSILDVIAHGDIKWSDISNDNIHPNVPGHKIVSQLLQSYLSDVAADVDNISGDESDFSTPATNAGFVGGKLLGFNDIEPTETTGTVTKKESDFGGFHGVTICIAGDEGTSLTYEVEAKSIGLLYGMNTANGGMADVYIDDELVTTLNSDFAGGWGNYVECAHLKTFDESGKHTVKIDVREGANGGKNFIISSLAIS
ncbi:MAG: SGNH/GDSL hydrolase family protein [Eubacterium sp.]|nr:SGNH/GDSL hydrolase family protein [Eubacterium sp.]